MILSRIFRTYTFRFTVLYVLTISVLATAISTLVYLFMARDYLYEVDRHIQIELQSAVRSYQQSGVEGLNNYVLQSTIQNAETRYHILLLDDNGEILAGNLSSVPQITRYFEARLAFIQPLLNWHKDHQDTFMGRD